LYSLILKRILYIFFVLFFYLNDSSAQMYPWFTQYRSNLYMYNPGFCGTRRIADARMFYRNQWVGFEGAPVTYAASLHFRYWKGKLGTGFYIFQDNIGPFQTKNMAGTVAYHLKLGDVEVSAGMQVNYISQSFIGTKITLHNQIDKSINQFGSDKSKTLDGSAGLVLYNERFYVALGFINLIGGEMKYFGGNGKYKNEAATSIGIGYNFAEDEDYVFENSVLALYTKGLPFYMDYTIRMHVKRTFFTGVSLRMRDAIAIHAGVTLNNSFQLGYSYDIVTSKLRYYQGGSHEIKLVFSSNLGKDQKKKGVGGKFLNKKFQYLL